MDTLLNFSGGIDSTLCLYNYLRDNPHKTLLINHVNLKNHEGRQDVENAAVHKILKKIQEMGYKNFRYIESSFDYGSIGWIVKDHELIAFFSGTIFRAPKYKDLKNIIVPFIKMEMHTPGREVIYRRVFEALNPDREYNMIFPLIDMTKEEIIKATPKELLELTWYCRTPKEGKPCGKCITCVDVHPHL